MPLLTHTAYLINLATCDDALWERSVEALADEIVRGALLAADGVVTHIGASGDGDPDRAALRVARAIDRAFALAGGPLELPWLLLENTAGAGSQFGGSFEEIGAVLSRLGYAAGRVAVCIDTCHAHAYGHDVTTVDGWERLLRGIEASCGVSAVRAIHANDCAFPVGSKRDRHEWIGQGAIGEGGFAAMIGQPTLGGIAAITEMPGETPAKDAINVARLISLRDGRRG